MNTVSTKTHFANVGACLKMAADDVRRRILSCRWPKTSASSPRRLRASVIFKQALGRNDAVEVRAVGATPRRPKGECAAPDASPRPHQTVRLQKSGDEGVAATSKRRGVASILTPIASFWLSFAMLLSFVATPSIRAESQPGKAAATRNGRIELRPQWVMSNGVYGIEYKSGQELIGSASSTAPAGVELRVPGQPFKPVEFRAKKEHGHKLELGPTTVGALTVRLEIERINPSLIKRTLFVTAQEAQRFAASFDFFPAPRGGSFATFTSAEPSRNLYDTLGGGPEYPDTVGQTFPMAAFRNDGRVFGIVADSPAVWENRCLMLVDPAERKLAVMTGDGRDSYPIVIKYDAKDSYKYQMDGWQALATGETKSYETWIFADKAVSQYDVQLAAHLALANAKGWNHSALEAILRNTSYLLCRRNLMRDESRYLFISGIGYGWKQWVSDGFWMAIGLDDREKLIEAYRAVFENRVTYEDNAQYYLIWSALAKRAGGKVNQPLAQTAFDFIRKHETNGLFYPPSLAGTPSKKGWKTYMDILEYDDDDAPVSNQGFHCGALMAAGELGFSITETDIQRAIVGYQKMFNKAGGYFPTSIKQADRIGQDTLYGAALTYAVFGRKILDDASVQTHLRTTARVQSPYGMRVISQADGSLLPNHNGSYVYGGSWFLCDAANYLVGELHGMPADEVNKNLISRIEKELAFVPAFSESISTVTGKPHGHILYSWNSGYWWLRKEFRKRQKQKGPDPVEVALDEKLGVVRDKSGLRLEPGQATLRPRN